MKYKILIVKNRYNKSLKVGKYLDWFKHNTPIEITTDEISTDFDVTTKKVSNNTYSGVICGDDIYDKLRTVIPEGKYHAVVFVYGNSLNGIRVNSSIALPLYPGTDLIQLTKVSDKGKVLNHEIFHTFFHRLQRQQIDVADPMDTYYRDSNMDITQDTNRSRALKILSPYWDKIVNIITLNMKYKYFSEKEIIGLKPELVQLLDKMRGECGFPFIINSGHRTKEYNDTLKDAVKDSAHTTGEAVDLACVGSIKRIKIVQVALANGINRIGIGDTFVHLDISKVLPQNVMWLY